MTHDVAYWGVSEVSSPRSTVDSSRTCSTSIAVIPAPAQHPNTLTPAPAGPSNAPSYDSGLCRLLMISRHGHRPLSTLPSLCAIFGYPRFQDTLVFRMGRVRNAGAAAVWGAGRGGAGRRGARRALRRLMSRPSSSASSNSRSSTNLRACPHTYGVIQGFLLG